MLKKDMMQQISKLGWFIIAHQTQGMGGPSVERIHQYQTQLTVSWDACPLFPVMDACPLFPVMDACPSSHGCLSPLPSYECLLPLPSYKNINKMSDISHFYHAFEVLQQQHSSFRDSLLLSPYCLSYNQKQQDSEGDSWLEYLKPHLNRTEQKKGRRLIGSELDGRKKTIPDHHESEHSTQEALEDRIGQLTEEIGKRDKIIAKLQMCIGKSKKNSRVNTVGDVQGRTAEQKRRAEEKRAIEDKVAGLKKEIIFLTHNSQELFEEVKQLREYSCKLKKVMARTFQYGKELEQSLRESKTRMKRLERENNQLLTEKEEMMANYEEEARILNKMKKALGHKNGSEFKDSRTAWHNKTSRQGKTIQLEFH